MKKIMIIPLAFLVLSCDLILEPVLDSRYRISGTYYVSEYSEYYRSTTTYQISIRRGYGNTVYIDNFYDAGLNVSGTMSGNRIDIYRQYCGGYEIQGVAHVDMNSISMTYSVRDTYNRSTDFCNSVANKW